jgi:Flp pilus assembly protein TadG
MTSAGRMRANSQNRARPAAHRLFGAWRRVAKDTSGAAAVEFALVVWPFIILIFACLQTFLIFFLNQSIQTVADQSGRMYMTGQAVGLSQANFKTAVCGKLPAPFSCSNVMVDVQVASSAASLNTAPIALTYNPCNPNPPGCGQPTNSFSYSGSSPRQYAILRVMYDWPVLGGVWAFANQPNGDLLMVGTSVFQVEPYPS